jgi:hypothetical protein
MNRVSRFLLLFASLWLCVPGDFSEAQTTGQAAPFTSVAPLVPAVKPPAPADQWVSHQMNQPPPETGDKYTFSPGLIDEIKELYVQAKKEYEAKAKSKTQSSKDNSPKTAPPANGK